MNILMIPTWYSSKKDPNAGVFTLEQSLELAKHENVAIFYPFDTDIDEKFLYKEENGILTFRYRRFDSNIPILPKIINSILILLYFKTIIKVFKPDILHAHVSTQAGYITRIISKIYDIPYVVSEHLPRYLLINNSRNRKVAKKVFDDSKIAIGVSNHLCNDLSDISHLTTLYNGINVKYEDKMVDTINASGINIGVVGSFYNKEVKGFNYLLESIAMLVKEYSSISIHLIGDGEFRSFYEVKAKELFIDKNIIFYGYKNKPETMNIISKCDFVVSSSIVETFGISIGEALMLGKPVVITKSGAPEEFVISKVGIIVENKNSLALAEGIKSMIINYSQYNSNFIKKYAEDTLGMDICIKKHLKIYSDIIEKEI